MENKKTFFKFICLTPMTILLFIFGNLIPIYTLYYCINIMIKQNTSSPIFIVVLIILWLIGYYIRITKDYNEYKKIK